MRSHGRITGALALFAATTMAACAPAMQNSSEGPAGFFGNETTIEVENNNWQDMTVYVVRDGMRMRLGAVSSLRSEKFKLSPAMVAGVGDIRLLADPLGSANTWMSEPILVMPGQNVRFKVENNIRLSSYAIY